MTPYEVLGVPTTATLEEIRQAYKQLVREYHPDKIPSEMKRLRLDAEEKLKAINAAYGALKQTAQATCPRTTHVSTEIAWQLACKIMTGAHAVFRDAKVLNCTDTSITLGYPSEILAKAAIVATIAIHIAIISIKAHAGLCNPKNIIDHTAFSIS